MSDRVLSARLGWIDGLILTATLAAGLAVAILDPKVVEEGLGLGTTERDQEAELAQLYSSRPDLIAPTVWRREIHDAIIRATGPVLPAITLGLAAATFRHRAARSRRALRRIGLLTTAVTAIASLITLANECVLRWFTVLQFGFINNRFETIWSKLGIDLGLGLAALWAVLAIGRRWKGEPGWHDRLGRSVGAGWIGYAMLAEVLKWVFVPV